jgi:hypothetical protein
MVAFLNVLKLPYSALHLLHEFCLCFVASFFLRKKPDWCSKITLEEIYRKKSWLLKKLLITRAWVLIQIHRKTQAGSESQVYYLTPPSKKGKIEKNPPTCAGYGAKRRAHDPDYEHVENAKYREYERLEAEGYDDEIKDPETNRPVIKKVRERGMAAVAKGPKVRPQNSKDLD